MRLVSFACVATIAVFGCSLYETEKGPDVCNNTGAAPAVQASLVNPATLQCESFNGTSCDEQCGPCPAILSPIPTWGSCSSSCRGLDESACETASQCRVARDWNQYYSNSPNSFLGCYPLDMQGDPPSDIDTIQCAGRDAQGCSRDSACTALYTVVLSNGLCVGCSADSYKECIPAKQVAGQCYLPVLCNIAPPPCPAGTTPGVAGNCYSGACIPDELCADPPPGH